MKPNIDDLYASEFHRHLTQFRAHLAGSDRETLHPSYISPAGYWTSSEKDAFFHAISIHSRFRPDLIAACVHTKSVVDVCAYIDALEDGCSKNTAGRQERVEIEGSMEVSNAWVQWEEERSADLIVLECGKEDNNYEKQWKDEKKGEEEGSNLERRWMQEKALRQLDIDHLRVMEVIFRNPLSETGPIPADHSPPPDRLPGIIDSTLRTSNSGVESTTSGLRSSVLSSIPCAVDEAPADPPELSPAARRRLQKRLYMRKKRAEKTGSEFTPAITKLRPGRKTKEKVIGPWRENDLCRDDPDEDSVNTDRSIDPYALPESQDMPHDHEYDDDLTGHAHRSKGGLTKPYKIRKKFASQGVDANVLARDDLGLFNFSTLSCLMERDQPEHGTPNTLDATAISVDTIRLMTAIVTEFVTDIVHRTILFREQEKIMKGNIKVYGRTHDHVTLENVDHILKMMGSNPSRAADCFTNVRDEETVTTSWAGSEIEDSNREMEGRYRSPTDKSTSIDGENDDGSLCLQDTALFSALPLRYELCPPLVYLPKSFVSGDLEAALLLMDTDEADLQNELKEEQEIDDADAILAKNYQTKLWKDSGKGNIG